MFSAYPIMPGKRFRYVGPGEGRGLGHTVVDVSDGMVVTWSDPSGWFGGGGQSWFGPLDIFAKHFRPEGISN